MAHDRDQRGRLDPPALTPPRRRPDGRSERAEFGRPRLWAILALVVVAFNLRPALSSISPVLAEIRAETHLSATAAGILTMLPVLCLGVFGPLAPRLARRIGAEPTVLAFLAVLALGLALRGLSIPGLFLGMVLAGAGIGVVGVLLPGLIKRDFAQRPGPIMGVYTMVLCGGAAAGAGLTAPAGAALGWGWSGALVVWAAPAALAAAIWAPLALRSGMSRPATPRAAAGDLLRDPLAWAVTAFMGLQSSLAYIVFGWLPVILRERGLDAFSAGWVSSASILAQMATALLVPVLAATSRAQRMLISSVMILALVGFALTAGGSPGAVWPGAILLGLGLGGSFGAALTLIVLRAPDAQSAADLSGMAQSIGYAIASLGPLAVGAARDWSGGWTLPIFLYTGLALTALVFGLRAGRPGHVLERASHPPDPKTAQAGVPEHP